MSLGKSINPHWNGHSPLQGCTDAIQNLVALSLAPERAEDQVKGQFPLSPLIFKAGPIYLLDFALWIGLSRVTRWPTDRKIDELRKLWMFCLEICLWLPAITSYPWCA